MDKRTAMELALEMSPRMAGMIEEWCAEAVPVTRQTQRIRRHEEGFFDPWRNEDRWLGACEER